jgi:FkbM family methyltransferase
MLINPDPVKNLNFKSDTKNLLIAFESTALENRWAFGRNVYSEALANLELICGFIDDFVDEREWMGLPVIRSSEIDSEYFIVIASGGNTLSIKRKLDNLNVERMDYFAFQKWSKFNLPEIRFNEGFEEHFNLNVEKFEHACSRLHDRESKEILEKLIKFRLTQNLDYLYGFFENQENQYFDFVCQLKGEIVNFVDIGSYHAENTLTFLRNYPNYSRIIIVEPNTENFQVCVSETKEYENISYIQAVLGGDVKTVEFSGAGTTGLVVESGGTKVQMKTLDQVCDKLTGTTLIKMDVEGGEEQILLGGLETLKSLRPVLAISGYHRVQDFWRIPEIVFSILDRYTFYVRHYTETIYETVFYFVPNEINQELI